MHRPTGKPGGVRGSSAAVDGKYPRAAGRPLCVGVHASKDPDAKLADRIRPATAHNHRVASGSRTHSRRTPMPKGQQRSNREAKKPKQQKKPAPPAAPFGGGPFKTPPAVPGRKA
jgi:hypothetical protein